MYKCSISVKKANGMHNQMRVSQGLIGDISCFSVELLYKAWPIITTGAGAKVMGDAGKDLTAQDFQIPNHELQ